MLRLIKFSAPGWVREYDTIEELTSDVYDNTCRLCKDSYGTDLEGMLWSDCGCEYRVDGLDSDGLLEQLQQLQDVWEDGRGK